MVFRWMVEVMVEVKVEVEVKAESEGEDWMIFDQFCFLQIRLVWIQFDS